MEQEIKRVSKEESYSLWKELIDKASLSKEFKYCQIYWCVDDRGEFYYKIIAISENAELKEIIMH